MSDLIDRQALLKQINIDSDGEPGYYGDTWKFIDTIKNMPNVHDLPKDTDTISRQQAIDALDDIESEVADGFGFQYEKWRKHFADLPSAQPQHTCLNCGRTANNGGWYEDGRTRCPIEEHYALPKDGYCHLWEKRKDWEDDYVKRAEEGEK